MNNIKLELPEGFLNEETRNDYVISKEMKAVWAVELDLLNELLRVCNKYNIQIFASGGTMLGAVRHGGFIPWDDDIDMTMLREEYDKLCNVAQQEFKYPYFFQTEYSDPGSLRGHAQLRNSATTGILDYEKDVRTPINQGIFIDIFPLDNVIDDVKLLKKQEKYVTRHKTRARSIANLNRNFTPSISRGIKKFGKYVLHYPVKLFDSIFNLEEKEYRTFEKYCEMYNTVDTEVVSSLSFAFNSRDFKKKKDYIDPIFMKFEFMEIPVCREYDEVLKSQYGDYMKLVKGTSYHGGLIFDTEKSYTEYLRRK